MSRKPGAIQSSTVSALETYYDQGRPRHYSNSGRDPCRSGFSREHRQSRCHPPRSLLRGHARSHRRTPVNRRHGLQIQSNRLWTLPQPCAIFRSGLALDHVDWHVQSRHLVVPYPSCRRGRGLFICGATDRMRSSASWAYGALAQSGPRRFAEVVSRAASIYVPTSNFYFLRIQRT